MDFDIGYENDELGLGLGFPNYKWFFFIIKSKKLLKLILKISK